MVETVLTNWIPALLVDANKAVLPEYSAVRLWLPEANEFVVKVATPVLGSTLAVPITVLPSLKVMIPPLGLEPPLTVAVRVTGSPGLMDPVELSPRLTLEVALAIWMVKLWLALLTPLKALTSTVKEPLAPSSGVPESTPRLERTSPAGNTSLVLKVKVLGLPLAVNWKLPEAPMVKFVPVGLVMEGGPKTSSVKVCVAWVPKPFEAFTVKLWLPATVVLAIEIKPLLSMVTPVGSPVSEKVLAGGAPVVFTWKVLAVPLWPLVPLALVIATGAFTVRLKVFLATRFSPPVAITVNS